MDLADKPVPQLTETIQHSVFKYGIPPLLLYGLLNLTMRTFSKPDVLNAPPADGGDA